MDKVLKIREAAALIGASSQEIHDRIADGRLQTVCGQVFFSDLAAAFPHITIEDVDMCARVSRSGERARANARSSKVDTNNVDTLKARIRKLDTQAGHWQDKAMAHEQSLLKVQEMLRKLQLETEDPARFAAIIQWIDSRLRLD